MLVLGRNPVSIVAVQVAFGGQIVHGIAAVLALVVIIGKVLRRREPVVVPVALVPLAGRVRKQLPLSRCPKQVPPFLVGDVRAGRRDLGTVEAAGVGLALIATFRVDHPTLWV